MAKKRVNIFMPEHIHAWFQSRSEEVGVSMSGLMCLALEEHIIQRQALNDLSSFNKLVEEQKAKINFIGDE